MALTAMSIADTVDYVSDADPAKRMVPDPAHDPEATPGLPRLVEEIGSDASHFSLGALDVFLMAHIYDAASTMTGREGSNEIGIQTRLHQTNVEAVRFGLRGWANFKDAKGNDVAFTTVKRNVNGRNYVTCSDEVMNALGIQLIAELATKIKAISQVSQALEKN